MALVRQKHRIGVHGHRGSRGTFPENTFPGYAESVAAGADYFEIDVHLTKDDVPVVFHDPIISGRLCLGPDGEPVATPLALRELLARDLEKYDVGVTQQAFPKQKRLPNERIPTLDALLKWASQDPKRRINIEIKMEATKPKLMPDPELMATKVLELVVKHGMKEKVIVQSFDFRPLEIVRAMEPTIPLSCLYASGESFATVTLQTGAKACGPFFELVTKENVEECHRHGIEVLPWTVNEPAAWAHVISCGVDGIITDFPRDLLDFLKSHG